MNKRLLAGGAVALVAVLAVVTYVSIHPGALKGDMFGDTMMNGTTTGDESSMDNIAGDMMAGDESSMDNAADDTMIGGGSSMGYTGDQWEPTAISDGDTTIVDADTGDSGDDVSSSEGMDSSFPSGDVLSPSPAPPVAPPTCKQPKPNKVRILGGAGINKGLLVEGPAPDRTDDVRKVVTDELTNLAGTKAADYQAKKAPYDKVTPFVCPEPAKCDVQVKGSFTTNPDPVKVTYKTGPNRYEGDAKFDLFAEATCVPKTSDATSSAPAKKWCCDGDPKMGGVCSTYGNCWRGDPRLFDSDAECQAATGCK